MFWHLLIIAALVSLGALALVLQAWVEKIYRGGTVDWQGMVVLLLFLVGIGLFSHAMALRHQGFHRRAALVLGLLSVVMLPYGLALAWTVYAFIVSGARF